ncbi:MAG: hypothetical protein RLZZ502_774, partial [Pseudomonadota bacterium]
MKYTGKLFVLCAYLLCGTLMAQNKNRALDRVVAVVNDEVITLSEFSQQKASVLANLRRQNVTPPALDVLEKQVLERFINERAEMQQAKDQGIKIDEPTLENALEVVAKNNKLTRDSLREALLKDGVTWARFREELRIDLTLRRLREREVDSRIVITESEIDNFIFNKNAQGGNNEEYQLAHILVLLPDQNSAEQMLSKEKRANDALAALTGGQSFAQVAAVYSDASDAVSGGNLGWRASERLPNIFAEVVKRLAVGQNSAVLKSPNG